MKNQDKLLEKMKGMSEDDIMLKFGVDALFLYMDQKEKNCQHPKSEQMKVLPRSGQPHITCKACWKSWPMTKKQAQAFDREMVNSLRGKPAQATKKAKKVKVK